MWKISQQEHLTYFSTVISFLIVFFHLLISFSRWLEWDFLFLDKNTSILLPRQSAYFSRSAEAADEWEYAARGGNQSKGYAFSGSDDVMEVAHFGAGVPCKVGMYKPNELGIYDMTGNVNEYVHRVDEKGMRAGSQGGVSNSKALSISW